MNAYYIIFSNCKDQQWKMYSTPLHSRDQNYLIKQIIPALRPMSIDEYSNGPAAFLNVPAHYSYVLLGENVYWCVEWEPGLIVVMFSPDGIMQWTAMRSPIPDFRGRTPNAEDLLEDEVEFPDNSQYNLVYEAWDPQLCSTDLEGDGFFVANHDTEAIYNAALAPVIALTEKLSIEYAKVSGSKWMDQCFKNIAEWAGEGVLNRKVEKP